MPDKELVWLHSEVKTPPFSTQARRTAGFLLRLVQAGATLSMPPIAPRCHELRIRDGRLTWRIIYRVDQDAIVIGDVFAKKTPKTPPHVIQSCRRRFELYDSSANA